MVRGQFHRTADRPPLPPPVVSDDVTAQSRARRSTSALLRRVRLALADGVVRPASPPQGVRLPFGVSRAGVPLSSDRQHLSYDVCLEVGGEIIRTVLLYIVY